MRANTLAYTAKAGLSEVKSFMKQVSELTAANIASKKLTFVRKSGKPDRTVYRNTQHNDIKRTDTQNNNLRNNYLHNNGNQHNKK